MMEMMGNTLGIFVSIATIMTFVLSIIVIPLVKSIFNQQKEIELIHQEIKTIKDKYDNIEGIVETLGQVANRMEIWIQVQEKLTIALKKQNEG